MEKNINKYKVKESNIVKLKAYLDRVKTNKNS